MPNPKEGLPKQEKSLLNSQNIRNITANIYLTRNASMPSKIMTSVTRKGIFLASMIVMLLSIKKKLQKDPANSKKNVNYVIQVVANKMFETGIIQKIIIDSNII